MTFFTEIGWGEMMLKFTGNHERPSRSITVPDSQTCLKLYYSHRCVIEGHERGHTGSCQNRELRSSVYTQKTDLWQKNEKNSNDGEGTIYLVNGAGFGCVQCRSMKSRANLLPHTHINSNIPKTKTKILTPWNYYKTNKWDYIKRELLESRRISQQCRETSCRARKGICKSFLWRWIPIHNR